MKNPDIHLNVGDRLNGGFYAVPQTSEESEFNRLNWDIDIVEAGRRGLLDENPYYITFRPNLAYIGISLKRITDFVGRSIQTNVLGITRLEKDIIHSSGGLKDIDIYSEEYGSKRKISGDQEDSDERESDNRRSFERYRFNNAEVIAHKGDPWAGFLRMEFKKTVRFLGDPKKAWDFPLGNGRKKDSNVEYYSARSNRNVVHRINDNKVSYLKRIKEVLKRCDGVANNYYEIRVGLMNPDAIHSASVGGSSTTMGAIFFSCLLNGFDPLLPIRSTEFKEKIAAKMGRIIVEELNRNTVSGVKPRIESKLRILAKEIRDYVKDYIEGGVKPMLDQKTMWNRAWKQRKDASLYAAGIDEAMYESGQLCDSIGCETISETRKDALRVLWSNLDRVKKLIAKRKKTLENFIKAQDAKKKTVKQIKRENREVLSKASGMSEEEKDDYIQQLARRFLDSAQERQQSVLKKHRAELKLMRESFPALEKYTDEQLLTAKSTFNLHIKRFHLLYNTLGMKNMVWTDPNKKLDPMQFSPEQFNAFRIAFAIRNIRGEVDRRGVEI